MADGLALDVVLALGLVDVPRSWMDPVEDEMTWLNKFRPLKADQVRCEQCQAPTYRIAMPVELHQYLAFAVRHLCYNCLCERGALRGLSPEWKLFAAVESDVDIKVLERVPPEVVQHLFVPGKAKTFPSRLFVAINGRDALYPAISHVAFADKQGVEYYEHDSGNENIAVYTFLDMRRDDTGRVKTEEELGPP